ncbi:MAG: PA14 domain-containing protein [Anaerolineae bacterium]
MISPTPTVRSRSLPRWLLLLIGIVVVGALLALLFFLLRRVGPQSEPVLRIAPAAAAVDDAVTVALNSSGWPPNEDVAICLNAPDDAACDEVSALLVDAADGHGNLDLLVEAGAYLAQGRTVFLARGLDSGQQVSRAFRVLRPVEGSPLVADVATDTPVASQADLTPIAAGQATDEPLAQDGGVWVAEYFANPDLAGPPALVRNDPDPNLDWGEESPAPGIIPADGFSVRWSRSVEFLPGLYRFVLTSDDGGRLRIEGETVIDAWQGAAGQTNTADQALSGGQYQVVVEHRDLAGPASSLFGWTLLTTPTPGQIAGVDFTATPTVTPIAALPVTPDDLPTAEPTAEPFIPPGGATNTPEATLPAATETPAPTSSFTASPTPTNGTPPGTATPESNAGHAHADRHHATFRDAADDASLRLSLHRAQSVGGPAWSGDHCRQRQLEPGHGAAGFVGRVQHRLYGSGVAAGRELHHTHRQLSVVVLPLCVSQPAALVHPDASGGGVGTQRSLVRMGS